MTRSRTRIVVLIGALLGAMGGVASAQPGDPGGAVAPSEPPPTCVPQCRAGFVCHQGQCISACNPACDPGQTCTAAGECIGPGTQLGVVGSPGDADPGWGRGAYTLSIITAIVVGALTTGIVIADDEEIGLALGIPATLIGGVAIPIVAAGGSSARRGGNVRGMPGLRITGWILYGLAMADAIVLIGLAFGDTPAPAPVAGSVGLLGVGSSLALGIDARRSAIEAESMSGNIGPGVGVARDAGDKLTPTVGLKITW